MPYRLYIKDSGKQLGTLTDAQLQTLVELLEEEDEQDHDYYIDRDMLDFLQEEGADEQLLAMIRPHVTEDDGIEIEWREEK
jgi:hypothetical protein